MLAGIKKKRRSLSMPRNREGPAVTAGFCGGILIAINRDQ